MTQSNALPRLVLAGLAALGGCSGLDDPMSPGGDVATVALQLSSVPADTCVVVDAASPTRSMRWTLPENVGSSGQATLTNVPIGQVRFNAAAYDGACVDDAPVAGAVATWVADEQRVVIQPGVTSDLDLVLHPASGEVSGTVGFQTPVVQIALGELTSYAVLADGRLFAWGDNSFGQLAAPVDVVSRARPQQVLGLPASIVQVAAGTSHACVIASDHSVWCWGGNGSGQLGDGTTASRRTPVQVALPGVGEAASLALGRTHSCALLTDGSLTCWGSNLSGELGQGPAPAVRTTPTFPMSDGPEGGFVQVAAATNATCVLRNLGRVMCSGLSGTGSTQVGVLTAVDGPLAIASLAMGAAARNAIRADGQVLSWSATTTPVLMPDVTDALEMSVGSGFACAVRNAGTVACWGSNVHGQLGDGTGADSTAARRAGTLTHVVQVAAGSSHACAVTDVGSLYCWGRNRFHALGLGDLRSRFVPTRVAF